MQVPAVLVNPVTQVVQAVLTVAHWRQLVTVERQLGETQAPLMRLNPVRQSVQVEEEEQVRQLERAEEQRVQVPAPSIK